MPEDDVVPRRSGHGGALWAPESTRFRLRSRRATGVELALFDDRDRERLIQLHRIGDCLWQVDVDRIEPGQRYGYRVAGPWQPESGDRFNPHKLLLDPYALAIDGALHWHPAVGGETAPRVSTDPDKPIERMDSRDSAPYVPKSVVVDLGASQRPRSGPEIPWSETVLYETHVRGLTQLHPTIPPELRGTYLGLPSRPVIDHLQSLGVTTLELMPVQHSESEHHLARSGLTNYWGYSPLGWFAPDARFASGSRGQQVVEFRQMVDALHAAGFEVLLDVVFNHTVEGGAAGPTLSLRGIDNQAHYRLAQNQRHDRDYTGCGNTVDLSNEANLDLVIECLRHWVVEMGVDGFRFDLATALGRASEPSGAGFSTKAPLFQRIASHPDLQQTKLIAEPWDLGPDGYQLGSFPPSWLEWNDHFRDQIRRFWRGDPFGPGNLARCFAGSPERFGDRASIHYVTSHDGFTLADLVSYESKHNQANGEDNRDGNDHEVSSNGGVEGPTEDPAIVERRRRLRLAMLASVVLSSGVPMICHGDELGRTQRGNNNAYCQDNEISWVDWRLDPAGAEFLQTVRCLLRTRRQIPWLLDDDTIVRWVDSDGNQQSAAAEAEPGTGLVGVLWQRSRVPRVWVPRSEKDSLQPGETAKTVRDRQQRSESSKESLLLLLNPTSKAGDFQLPPATDKGWEVVFSTESEDASMGVQARDGAIRLPRYSLVAMVQSSRF